MATKNEAKIKFTADTQEFAANIKQANGTISSLKAQMKLAEAQFKNSGNAAEYLQQKHEILEKELEANKEKQEALTQEIEAAKRIYGENSTEAQAYADKLTYAQIQEQNLQKSLTDCDSELQNQKNVADDAKDSVSGLGDSSEESGNIFSQAWAAMSSAGLTFDISGIITAAVDALVDLGKQAIEAADEFDQSMAVMAEGTGATKDALTDLVKASNDAYESIADANQSAQDIAGTAGEINTRFGLTGDELTDLTANVSNFAKITGQDGASAVDGLADVIRQWGGDTEDCTWLMDALTYSAQACGDSASDLASGLSDNAYQWQYLGYSQEDALELMSQIAWAGGDISDMTSGMTKGIQALSGKVEDVPGTFQEAINMMKNWDGESDILQQTIGDTGLTIEDVFGKKAQSMAQALSTASQNTEDFSYDLDDCSGRMQQTADDSVTLKDEWDRLGKGIKDSVGETIGPALTDMVGFMADVATGEADFGGQISDTWNSTGETFKTMGAGIKTSADNLKSNLSATWSNIKQNASTTWQNMKSSASQSWSGLKTTAATSFSNLKSTISEKLAAAYNTAKAQFDKLKGLCNFTWKLPSLKLPHFTMSGSLSDWLTGKGSKPSISVSWYAKGGILNSPTIFGMGNNGNWLGGGEAGPEAVAPIDVLQTYVQDAVRDVIDYDYMAEIMARVFKNIKIVNNFNGRDVGRAVLI